MLGSSRNGSQTSGGGAELAEGEFAEHADDEVRLAAERDRLADGLAIAVEPTLPELPAEHDDALAPGQVFVDAERPAGLEWRAEEPEELGADVARSELLRHVAAGEIDDAGVERSGLLDHLVWARQCMNFAGDAAAPALAPRCS